MSRANAADQFTVKITHGAITDASATTAGAGASISTGATTLTSGTTYTLSEVMAAGSVSVIAQYSKSISCSNTLVGSATVLPAGAGASFTVTPQAGDVIWPTYSKHMDYELELAAVLGRSGRDIKNDASALDHIFGYTISVLGNKPNC